MPVRERAKGPVDTFANGAPDLTLIGWAENPLWVWV
jgi:hypothetical protein